MSLADSLVLVRPDDQAVGHEQRLEERPHAPRPRPLDLVGAVYAQRRLHRQRESGSHHQDLGGLERVRLCGLASTLRRSTRSSPHTAQVLHKDLLRSQRLGAERAAELGRPAAHQLLGGPGAPAPSLKLPTSRSIDSYMASTDCTSVGGVEGGDQGGAARARARRRGGRLCASRGLPGDPRSRGHCSASSALSFPPELLLTRILAGTERTVSGGKGRRRLRRNRLARQDDQAVGCCQRAVPQDARRSYVFMMVTLRTR